MGRLSSKERKKRKRLDELHQADVTRADAAPEAADPPVGGHAHAAVEVARGGADIKSNTDQW